MIGSRILRRALADLTAVKAPRPSWLALDGCNTETTPKQLTRNGSVGIKELLESDRQPPCNGCMYWRHCKDEREACELFARYCGELDYRKHLTQTPSALWYNRLFTDVIGYNEEIHGD